MLLSVRCRAVGTAIALAVIVAAPAAPAAARQAASGTPASETAALFEQGERALAGGRYADAQQSYERLRTLEPDRAEVHARLGLIYFQQGKFADAVPVLRRALALKPGLPNLDALLAMSLSEIGRHQEAVAALEQAFRQPAADRALRRLVGLHLQRTYTDLDRDADAVAVALELSRAYPDDPEVLYHTGRLFGNYAYLQTTKLARVAPDSPWLHQAAGEANESQGLFDQAIAEYRQVLAQVPKRPGIHFRIGRVLLTRAARGNGDVAAEAEAAAEFEQELAIDPTNANAAYELGELQRKSGKLDEAIRYFERAVAAYPEFEEALVGLGRALVAAGRAAAALPHLRTAVAVNPQNEVAFYQLAQAHRALDQRTEQQAALASFTRLRDQKARAREAAALAPDRPIVTPQVMDAARPQP
jgi:tetratricopeptide (TPR) repeat protein